MKKFIGILTAVSLLCGLSTAVCAEEQSYQQGDVDLDGILTGHDAAIVSKYADGILEMSLSEEQLRLADMDGDGEITQDDAALIAEKQEYGLCVIDEGMEVRTKNIKGPALQNGAICLSYCVIKRIDPNFSFGAREIRADVDCNGFFDSHDELLMYYCTSCLIRGEMSMAEGEYYILDPDPEDKYLKGCGSSTVYGRDCESWTEFIEKLISSEVTYTLDVNGDSKLNVNDASDILTVYAQRSAGIYQAPSESMMDVNLDGEINIEDATLVLKGYAMKAAGLI